MNANVTTAVSDPGIIAVAPARPLPAKARRFRLRRSLVAALLIAFAAAGAGAWWLMHAEARSDVAPVTVAVGRGTIQETVLATGTLQANSLVSVGAQVSGTIQTLNVKLGDQVKAGDTIATIDSLTQENKVKAAQAALAIVTAQKAAEQVNFTKVDKAAARADQLLAEKQLSQADDDTAVAARDASSAQLQALDAQIQQATLNVQSAQLDLSRTTITAPVGGTVVAILVDQGQTVNAAQTTPTIVKIADLDSMIINAKISEADVTRVEPGQKVTFTVLGDPTPIKATLSSIEPAPDSIETDTTTTDTSATAIYYDGLFTVPNPDHKLRISMTAEVTVVLGEADNVLSVPSSALVNGRDGTTSVRVYDAGTKTVALRPVTVGLNNKVSAEIKSGLALGDRVVTGTAGAAPAVPAAAGARPGGGGLGGFGR